MVGILYRIFGNLTLKCEGGFTGQFLNMCRGGGVNFRNARCKEDCLYIDVTPAEIYAVRHAARESGMKVKIISRSGLVFPFRRYRKRTGMAVGLVLFMLVLYHLSGFVWNVELVGESRYYSDEDIYSALEKNGISIGEPLKNIEADRTENSILTELTDLKRLAISVDATTVTVEIADKSELNTLPETETGYPCDIVSTCDAQIISVVPYAGEALVRPGDTVRKGQILVSGMFEDSVGRTYLTESKAEIIGQITLEKTFEISALNEKMEPTGQKTEKTSINFFGLRIKFYSDSGNRYPKCDIIKQNRQLTLFDKKLPISIETVTESELTVDERMLTEDELEKKVLDHLKAFEEENIEGVIVSRRVELDTAENKCFIRASYVINCEIGQKKRIYIE